MSDAQALTPGSLNTPIEGSLKSRVNQQPNEAAAPYKTMDRFRFDAASTGNYINHGGASGGAPARLNNGTGCSHDSSLTYRGSQGNLHQYNHNLIPHTSCTSIAQNLSTSDQQPLIVDVQHDRCQHHYQQHNHQQQHHHPTNHVCLKTTSFMADPSSTDCTCFEHQTFRHSSGGGDSAGHLFGSTNMNGYQTTKLKGTSEALGSFYNDQKKSRTLTKVYQPLNDLHFPNTSTNNLMDSNFYISPDEDRAKKHL